MVKSAALIALLGGLLFQDVENPEYKHWSKFKAGAFAKTRMEMDSAGMKIVTTSTTTLKSIDKDKAVVASESETEMMGNKTKSPLPDREVPAKVKKVEPARHEGPKPEEGDETIEAAGKKWKCHWVKTTSEVGGTKSTTTIWTCDDVPGYTVKMTMDGAAKGTMVLVECKTE
jgi:hypothetical protein